MIRNILFDMGNVLIQWTPEAFIRRAGVTGEDAALLLREVYLSVTWVALDRGALTDDEAVRAICARVPARLHAAVDELVRRWDAFCAPMPGMTELAQELSDAGYGLYLLTNAALRHREYWPRFPVSRLFGDRIMRSADWRLLKPEPAFYEKALSMFGLDRRACVFIDDSPVNAESAVRLGLDAIVFHGDAALVRIGLRERGVLL